MALSLADRKDGEMLRIIVAAAFAVCASHALAADPRSDREIIDDFYKQAELCRGGFPDERLEACLNAQDNNMILVMRGYCTTEQGYVKGPHRKDDAACQ
jgi:hypothetical protein